MAMIDRNKKIFLLERIHHQVFIVLLLFLVMLLGFAAMQVRHQWDVSQNGRNSLTEASQEILQELQGPVKVTAYATEHDAQTGDIRKLITDFISLYQRIKPDITLSFIDPAEQPMLTQEAGVHMNGELVIAFRDKREHLTFLNEQAFTNVLMRLARTEERLVVTLSGHGERKLDGNANFDLGDFGAQLRKNGLANQKLNLVAAQDIPVDTSVLMIASPQVDLLEGEVDKLLDYVERGGNLLWLVDQEAMRGLSPLAEKLHLTLTPGIVVDPTAQQLKAPITFTLGANYGQHPITTDFDYITVFPFARQITMNENSEWSGVTLVESASQGWVENGEIGDEVHFDQTTDVAGPIGIAVALTRHVADREQRVVVIGSGHFLANTYLGNGNNLDFGINIINWLVGDEELIVIQPRATIDDKLILSEFELTVIAIGFLMVLPLIFVLCGTVIWWQRKRRQL